VHKNIRGGLSLPPGEALQSRHRAAFGTSGLATTTPRHWRTAAPDPRMRTQLGTYCQQFDGTLRPVLLDLSAATAAIDAAAEGTPGKALRAPLGDLQHQLSALCDKVSEQQAYVLIFGPLKSGKSTLMNAIAAAYVSEVSSLPAYPCLVFTSAGKRREYVVTTYAGQSRTFVDSKELHRHIDHAHGQLAQAIRTAEQGGSVFDPQEHFPEAIRRVDVKVPDSELASTGAVLVDTPGLYTRMRFGYDRMTRDFRNAAACAIFVVKSDTLFLEQVFSEFQQLLDLFSRIFLVVNVDSHKRDVSPEGKLVPSLEQSQPEAVLRAFEQLAMSAPLQRAAAEGRVKMYPVDLMHAASSVLQKQSRDQQPETFRAFRQDLSDYLASSEYLSAFLRDSLQRAQTLLGETAAHCNGHDVQQLDASITALDEQIGFCKSERQRVQRALQLDWTEAFARTRREIEAEIERCARDAGAKLLRTLGASIDTWFLSSHSLDWLVQGQWTPLVRDYREDVHGAARRIFDQQQTQIDAGLDLADHLPELVRRAGIDLRAMKAQALTGLGAIAWQGRDTVPVDVGAAHQEGCARRRLLPLARQGAPAPLWAEGKARYEDPRQGQGGPPRRTRPPVPASVRGAVPRRTRADHGHRTEPAFRQPPAASRRAETARATDRLRASTGGAPATTRSGARAPRCHRCTLAAFAGHHRRHAAEVAGAWPRVRPGRGNGRTEPNARGRDHAATAPRSRRAGRSPQGRPAPQ
jgi:GTPase SAR1 family protein